MQSLTHAITLLIRSALSQCHHDVHSVNKEQAEVLVVWSFTPSQGSFYAAGVGERLTSL